jgi:NADP-dependent 3-hydroxy acid dehydrogenase YdfG
MNSKVVLTTGASSGIGLAAAVMLARAGHRVWGGARRIEQMQPLVEAGGHALPLDVTDEASMQAAVDSVLKAEGRLDVLINNAGYGLYGAVEDVPLEDARRQIETNVMGLARMTQLVLPTMRAQKTGRILNVSSMGGTIHTPLGAWYHGTKFFVEGFTNSMRLEVGPLGIDMVLIAPGGIDTGFNGIIGEQVKRHSGTGPYAWLARNLTNAAKPGAGSSPEVVARAIRTAVESPRPRTIYRMGQYGRLLPFLRRALPDRWFDRMVLTLVR